MDRYSNTIFAARYAVVSPAVSYAGRTSTISNPMKLRSLIFLTRSSDSYDVNPPTSGVPVPGAYAGSTKSISKVRKHGVSPTLL